MKSVNEAKDKDKINAESSLPFSFIIEMLHSFEDILNEGHVNFMVQVSVLLNEKLF